MKCPPKTSMNGKPITRLTRGANTGTTYKPVWLPLPLSLHTAVKATRQDPPTFSCSLKNRPHDAKRKAK